MKWEYFLRPNKCGLHQSYLIVIVKYIIEVFINSVWSLLNRFTNANKKKTKTKRKNERKELSLLFEALKLVSQKLYFTL